MGSKGGRCSDLRGYRRLLKAISKCLTLKPKGSSKQKGCAVASAPCNQTAGATGMRISGPFKQEQLVLLSSGLGSVIPELEAAVLQQRWVG